MICGLYLRRLGAGSVWRPEPRRRWWCAACCAVVLRHFQSWVRPRVSAGSHTPGMVASKAPCRGHAAAVLCLNQQKKAALCPDSTDLSWALCSGQGSANSPGGSCDKGTAVCVPSSVDSSLLQVELGSIPNHHGSGHDVGPPRDPERGLGARDLLQRGASVLVPEAAPGLALPAHPQGPHLQGSGFSGQCLLGRSLAPQRPAVTPQEPTCGLRLWRGAQLLLRPPPLGPPPARGAASPLVAPRPSLCHLSGFQSPLLLFFLGLGYTPPAVVLAV